ncbi:MAG: electron transfer flavoprotein subunit alpha/FixB family protein [Candidatus Schekmanbacteria bacterium]|nr:MAG: electron transfer flavoprotein subunit alpha/FixB family protein [Candidatus Schekmanbacteria bacterium]
MGNNILAFAEQREGKFKKSAYEVIGAAKNITNQTGGETIALVIGSGVEGIAGELGAYGADKVIVADNDSLKYYSGELYSNIVVEEAKKNEADVILMPASSMGRDLAPRCAAITGSAVAADSIAVENSDGSIIATRPVYAGKTLIKVKSSKTPFIISLRPNVFPLPEKEEGKNAEVQKSEVSVAGDSLKAIVKEIVASASGKMDLTEASVIVSGGRGMKGPENFKILEELADVLGGVVGASRSAVDAGWMPQAQQVGQTGKVVSPQLYIACGISGAIQHLAGMSSSKCIVAINKDPEAPIFQVADYGIVGDLFEVVPALTEEVKKVVSS